MNMKFFFSLLALVTSVSAYGGSHNLRALQWSAPRNGFGYRVEVVGPEEGHPWRSFYQAQADNLLELVRGVHRLANERLQKIVIAHLLTDDHFTGYRVKWRYRYLYKMSDSDRRRNRARGMGEPQTVKLAVEVSLVGVDDRQPSRLLQKTILNIYLVEGTPAQVAMDTLDVVTHTANEMAHAIQNPGLFDPVCATMLARAEPLSDEQIGNVKIWNE